MILAFSCSILPTVFHGLDGIFRACYIDLKKETLTFGGVVQSFRHSVCGKIRGMRLISVRFGKTGNSFMNMHRRSDGVFREWLSDIISCIRHIRSFWIIPSSGSRRNMFWEEAPPITCFWCLP